MEMINQINPVSYGQLFPAVQAAASSKASDQFLTIFYKELLKQVIKTPNFSPADDEDSGSAFASSFNSELMVQELAEQLAKRAALGPSWIPPATGEAK